MGVNLNSESLEGRKNKRLYAEGANITTTPGVVSFQTEVDTLITARLAARKAKNFAESDRIRDELLAMGIQLKDAKDPATGEMVTTWEVKR